VLYSVRGSGLRQFFLEGVSGENHHAVRLEPERKDGSPAAESIGTLVFTSDSQHIVYLADEVL